MRVPIKWKDRPLKDRVALLDPKSSCLLSIMGQIYLAGATIDRVPLFDSYQLYKFGFLTVKEESFDVEGVSSSGWEALTLVWKTHPLAESASYMAEGSFKVTQLQGHGQTLRDKGWQYVTHAGDIWVNRELSRFMNSGTLHLDSFKGNCNLGFADSLPLL